MSSHHIVRDEQEPALLVADANCCSREVIDQLLEWSPIVIATQDSLAATLQWGIKIDKVVCHPNFLKDAYKLTEHQFPINILPTEKNGVHFVIQYLIKKGYKAVTLCYNLTAADRMENFEQYSKHIDLIFYGNGYKGYFIKDDGLNKWVPADTVFMVAEEEHITKTQGLNPEGGRKFVAKNSSIVRIQADKPVFVMEK